ncbi:MAG: Fe-S cluster assembly ATPase SufC [Patescibacteria group bacterium]|nr:Fe-S cluster assembly ATPase SufC [Patescibacteria group bacterium]
MIRLKNVSVAIDEKPILKNINFEFEPGKIYAVMGPNGSGKSTLAYTIMGHPSYELQQGSRIIMNGEDITEKEANERAEKGIFLSFQSPLALAGVKVQQLLRLALEGKKDPVAIYKQVREVAKKLKISDDLLNRSLNEGASGGEKKKLEVLQAVVLDKNFLIFDEVDTGVDVDALKTIAQYLDTHREGKTYVIITHYNRILHYLKPDKVLVLAGGELKKVGDGSLAEEIEINGYESVLGGK